MRARRGATITSPSSSSKSATLEVDTSTTARGARTLEVRKSVIPMRILSKRSVRTYLGTLQRKEPQREEHMRLNNGPAR